MIKKSLLVTAVALVMLVAACANLKEPATKALSEAESALTALREDGAKLLPDQFGAAENALSAVRAKLTAGDYKGVIEDVPALTAKVTELRTAIAAKKAELAAAAEQAKAQFASVSGELPKLVAGVQGRLDELSKSKKLPKGLDKATFDSAKSDLEAVKQQLSEATGEFNAGNFTEAAKKATALKDKLVQLMTELKMKVS